MSNFFTPNNPALGSVFTTGFQSGLQSTLARGGDIIVVGDSIFSGRGDSWSNSVQNQLRDSILARFSNPGWESGYGYFSVGDQWQAASGTPTYFQIGGYSISTHSSNYVNGVTVMNTTGLSQQCRFSFPPTITGAGKMVYPIKRIELIISSWLCVGNNATNPTLTVDCYSSPSGPLSSGAAYITAGTASSITHNGLTGITQTFTPGNTTQAAENRLGVLTIQFDGITHNPVIQITSTDDCDIAGVILYYNDWDVDGKGVRYHDRCISGSQLLPTRSTQASGSPDWTAFNSSQGFMARYRSWLNSTGFAGTANAYEVPVNSPCCNTKLVIIQYGTNDELINVNTPSAFGAYYMDTVDAILNANPQAYILLVQTYCPGGICDPWRTGYSSGGGGNKTLTIVTWTAYMAVMYACQAKYPNNVACVSIDRLLGEANYATAITGRGWGQADLIHWVGNGPAFATQQIMSVLPTKGSFPISTGLVVNSLTANCVVAVRLDRFEKLQNYGSLGGTFTNNRFETLAGNRNRRTNDNLSVTFNETVVRPLAGYTSVNSIAPPQGNYTVFMRLSMTTPPYAGQANVSDIYGDVGGVASDWSVRVGTSGQFQMNSTTGTASSGSFLPFDGTWHTFAAVRSGTSLTYYLDGLALNTVTGTSTPGSTPGPRSIFEPTPGGGNKVGTVGMKISHMFEYSRNLSTAEIASLHANPDQIFILTA